MSGPGPLSLTEAFKFAAASDSLLLAPDGDARPVLQRSAAWALALALAVRPFKLIIILMIS